MLLACYRVMQEMGLGKSRGSPQRTLNREIPSPSCNAELIWSAEMKVSYLTRSSKNKLFIPNNFLTTLFSRKEN
jgi:hypothetical protein